jgi:putative DNA primase/helicase
VAGIRPASVGPEPLTAGEIAHHLHGKRSGQGYSCRCPAHDDRTPSLSIRESEGKILAKCHAGCPQEAVVSALKDLGLWPKPEAKRVIVNQYDYTDASGKPLYQVCRTDPKGFFQRCPDGYGGWRNRGPRSEDKVLYRLPEVLDAPIVFLVEGERDVETLRDYGFVATTHCGGAKAPWLRQYTETLRGREVILIPDNDRPGWERAKIIAAELLDAARPLILLDLPPDIKDVTDWFLGCHSELELIAMVEGARFG